MKYFYYYEIIIFIEKLIKKRLKNIHIKIKLNLSIYKQLKIDRIYLLILILP